jgi:hypothetical protein
VQAIVTKSPMVYDLQDPQGDAEIRRGEVSALGEPSSAAPFSTLRRAIEQSQRFHSDTMLGRLLHRGTASYRELSPVDAVHITIAGNRISAHVDDVSPVKQCADGKTRYSWARVLAHNVFVIGNNLARRLRGGHGNHRCDLACELVWVDEDGAVELSREEVECRTCTDDGTHPRLAVGRE